MGMGATSFLLFPIMIMTIGIIITFSGPTQINSSPTIQFCNPNQPSQCSNPNSKGTSYFCQPTGVLGVFQICKLDSLTCNVLPPAPASCLNSSELQELPIAIALGCAVQFLTGNAAACGVFLPANANVFIPSATIGSDLSTSGAFFAFSINGAQAFIAMIGIAVTLASIAAISVFSTGEGNEGVHILFMGGMFLGIWTILSALEGFIAGNPASMFSQLNLVLAGFGSFAFVVLTLSYTLGFVASVSRGSG